jgi:hypothetical protein
VDKIPEWISAISNAITAAGIAWAIYEFRNDHERSRREKAIDLLVHFDNSLELATSSSRKLIEKLSDAQNKAIFNHESLKIDIKLKSLTEAALNEKIKHKQGARSIELNPTQSSKLRWLAIKYLNLLETVLVAWHNGIADREIILTQLKYIYDPKESSMAMNSLREIAGGKDSYPSIQAFIEFLKKEHESPKKGKKQIG